jgi:rod shape determining protein RodA
LIIKPRESGRFWKDFDWLLLSAAVCLSVLSVVEIYSSTMAQPTENFFSRQLAWVCVGIVALFVVAAIDYHLIAEHIPWLYVLAIGALVYTLALGHTVAGSKSWVAFGPVAVQPSELIKMVAVVALARYLSELRSSRYMTFLQIAKVCIIGLVPMGLVALQPDLGTALTYMPAIAIGLFVRGVRPAVLVSLILGFVLILPVSWLVLKPPKGIRWAKVTR